jgi:geranylgeranyl pyrophosphate synthase
MGLFYIEYVKLINLQQQLIESYQAFVAKEFALRSNFAPTLYALENPGKLIRPLIMAAMYWELTKRDPLREIPNLMWAVELHHTYSLIHDDLPCMDNDDIRRGRPTLHKKFSESTAVLTGDSLLNRSYALLSQSPTPHLAKLCQFFHFCTGEKGLIAGQLMDLEMSKSATLKEILRIHELKTGRLFLFSFLAPLYFVENLKANRLSLLIRLAHRVGLLFQINDDWEDKDNTKKEGPNVFTSFPLEAKAIQQKLQRDVESLIKNSFPEFQTINELLKKYYLV